jgi:hypothetical protein
MHSGRAQGGQCHWSRAGREEGCWTVRETTCGCPALTLPDTLIKLLLTLSSVAMGLFTATAGYLYMTHSLSNPSYAPVAALLCGGVPFLAIRAGAAVLGDA